MKSYLELVKQVDNCPYPHEQGFDEFYCRQFTFTSHDGSFRLGYLSEAIVKILEKHSDTFEINDNDKTVQLSPTLNTVEKRTQVLNKLGIQWKDEDQLDLQHGWRNEHYVIYDNKGNKYFTLERSLCPWFGVIMYGVHINGFVKNSEGLKLWVPRRSYTKPTYPGKLDNTVAGGLGYPYGILETCYKECYEEAGLPKEYTEPRLLNVGVVSYLYHFDNVTVQPEIEYIFDLDMSDGRVPFPVDNEAMDFKLMDVEEIINRLHNDEFKYNCASVVIDFLIRHGIITASNERDYSEINSRLHRYLEFPLGKF